MLISKKEYIERIQKGEKFDSILFLTNDPLDYPVSKGILSFEAVII